MSYKIGIDFGTTNTVISYVNDTKNPMGFEYPAGSGSIYIPSLVNVYDDGDVAVGNHAMDFLGDGRSYISMKMYLPLNDQERIANKWPTDGKNVEEIIGIYFDELLLTGPNCFKNTQGKIDGVVLCVPYVWNKELTHTGRKKLLESFKEKGLNVIKIVSEPVAAAAYFKHLHREMIGSDFAGNLLVCDMGGGTLDVTVCRITNIGKIDVLFNDGHGLSDFGLGLAGVQFDRNLIKKAYRSKFNKEIDFNDEGFHQIYKQLQTAKRNARVTKLIESAKKSPNQEDGYNKTCIKTNEDLCFLYGDILESFQPIKEGMQNVFERVEKNLNGTTIEGYFLTGGFNDFILCRDYVIDYWKVQDGQLFDSSANATIAGKSIAFGAALIAEGIVDIDEYYPHSIGFIAYKRTSNVGQKQEKIYVPLITGGKKLSEYENATFSTNQYQAVVGTDGKLSFQFYCDLYGEVSQRQILAIQLPIPNSTKVKIGMRIDIYQIVYLMLEDVKGTVNEMKLLNINEFFTNKIIVNN